MGCNDRHVAETRSYANGRGKSDGFVNAVVHMLHARTMDLDFLTPYSSVCPD